MSNYKQELGKLGEEAAVRFLLQQGYRILCRNFRCNLGELDIVARQGESLVFIEVRTRSSTMFGWPQESVGYRKQLKLRQLASYYLTARPGRERKEKAYRFDVVAVILGHRGDLQSIELIRNAF